MGEFELSVSHSFEFIMGVSPPTCLEVVFRLSPY